MLKFIFIILMSILVLPILTLLLIAVIPLAVIAIMTKDPKSNLYGFNMLLSVDQLYNTVLGGAPDESISSRAGKRQKTQLWAKYLCKFLNLLDKNHCDKYVEEDEGKNQVLDD